MSKAPEPGICERLTRTVEHTRLYYTNRTAPPIECRVDECVNPDGPEAAAIIAELCAALQSIKGVGPVTRKRIDTALSRAGANR